jgi:hypothetical protein
MPAHRVQVLQIIPEKMFTVLEKIIQLQVGPALPRRAVPCRFCLFKKRSPCLLPSALWQPFVH